MADGEVTIYFPRGGNVDFSGCEIDSDFEGDCTDEQGRRWSFRGEPGGASCDPGQAFDEYFTEKARADDVAADANGDADADGTMSLEWLVAVVAAVESRIDT